MLGKRKGYPNSPMPPHNVPFVLIGAALLWVGWFGFNAGSAVAADGAAGMAQLVTQVATAAAAFTWMMVVSHRSLREIEEYANPRRWLASHPVRGSTPRASMAQNFPPA